MSTLVLAPATTNQSATYGVEWQRTGPFTRTAPCMICHGDSDPIVCVTESEESKYGSWVTPTAPTNNLDDEPIYDFVTINQRQDSISAWYATWAAFFYLPCRLNPDDFPPGDFPISAVRMRVKHRGHLITAGGGLPFGTDFWGYNAGLGATVADFDTVLGPPTLIAMGNARFIYVGSPNGNGVITAWDQYAGTLTNGQIYPNAPTNGTLPLAGSWTEAAWAEYTVTWTVNPITSLAWTWADLAALYFSPGAYVAGGGQGFTVPPFNDPTMAAFIAMGTACSYDVDFFALEIDFEGGATGGLILGGSGIENSDGASWGLDFEIASIGPGTRPTHGGPTPTWIRLRTPTGGPPPGTPDHLCYDGDCDIPFTYDAPTGTITGPPLPPGTTTVEVCMPEPGGLCRTYDVFSTRRWIKRLRRAPHLAQDNTRVVYRRFALDLERGQGTVTGQGSDPLVMLRVSRDGGQTWGEPVQMEAGKLGAYQQRVLARRLGHGRDVVFEVTVSDPIAWSLVNAWLELEGGGR